LLFEGLTVSVVTPRQLYQIEKELARIEDRSQRP
jgi:hypothetical protein